MHIRHTQRHSAENELKAPSRPIKGIPHDPSGLYSPDSQSGINEASVVGESEFADSQENRSNILLVQTPNQLRLQSDIRLLKTQHQSGQSDTSGTLGLHMASRHMASYFVFILIIKIGACHRFLKSVVENSSRRACSEKNSAAKGKFSAPRINYS